MNHTALSIGEEAGKRKTLRLFGSAVDQKLRIPEMPRITVKPVQMKETGK